MGMSDERTDRERQAAQAAAWLAIAGLRRPESGNHRHSEHELSAVSIAAIAACDLCGMELITPDTFRLALEIVYTAAQRILAMEGEAHYADA